MRRRFTTLLNEKLIERLKLDAVKKNIGANDILEDLLKHYYGEDCRRRFYINGTKHTIRKRCGCWESSYKFRNQNREYVYGDSPDDVEENMREIFDILICKNTKERGDCKPAEDEMKRETQKTF